MPLTYTPYEEDTLPAPLDIVWCRFPYEESPAMPGKPRPGLIFSTHEFREGEFSVQVAYGTSKLKDDRGYLDFWVTNLMDMHFCGLPQATRFNMDKVKFLPWAAEWFVSRDPNVYPTPKVGSLPSGLVPDLKALLRDRESRGLPVPKRGSHGGGLK